MRPEERGRERLSDGLGELQEEIARRRGAGGRPHPAKRLRSPHPARSAVSRPGATMPALYDPKPEIAAGARVGSLEEYGRLYRESLEDPDGFWRRQADRLDRYKTHT